MSLRSVGPILVRGAGSMIETQARVLVVDDEPDICRLLKWRLEESGYEVEMFTDPAEALDRFKRGRYELLISDIKMPRVNGMNLIHEIKRRDPDLASIVITGFASLDNAIDAVRHEVDDYLMKPFDVDEVAAAADRAVGNARYRKRRRTVVKDLHRANKALSRTSDDLRRRVKDAKAELLRRNYGVAQSFRVSDLLDLLAIEFDLSPAQRSILEKNENDLTPEQEEMFLGSLKQRLGSFREFVTKQYRNSTIPEPTRKRVWQLAVSDAIIQKGYVGIIDAILYQLLGREETYSITRMVERNPKVDRDGLVRTGRAFMLCRACHFASLVVVACGGWALVQGRMAHTVIALAAAFVLDLFGRKAPVIDFSALLPHRSGRDSSRL